MGQSGRAPQYITYMGNIVNVCDDFNNDIGYNLV